MEIVKVLTGGNFLQSCFFHVSPLPKTKTAFEILLLYFQNFIRFVDFFIHLLRTSWRLSFARNIYL